MANSALGPSGVTYDYDFAVNVVKATVATLATQAGIVSPDDPNHAEREPISTEDDVTLADAPNPEKGSR